jgi:hypothetical protein
MSEASDPKTHSAASIIAVSLLLLPLLYVGSYFAMVVPGGKWIPIDGIEMPADSTYRFGGSWSSMAFWPLEQIDRKVRPSAWEPYPSTAPNKRFEQSDKVHGGVI